MPQVFISNTRDTIGTMGLNVADVALLDAVLSEDKLVLHIMLMYPVSSLKIEVPRTYIYDNLDPDVAKVMLS